MIAMLLAAMMAQAEPKPTVHLVPPIEYQRDDYAVVFFVDDVERPEYCNRNANFGFRTMACTFTDRRLIFMPNPCPFALYEYYARLMCHEKGHISGWKH